MEKEKYMKIALEEARLAYVEDEVPIGCVIVKDGTILAKSHNEKVKEKKATFHAEIIAINRASEALDNWHLDDCDMYVTLEPCIMCAGAIINSRIKNVYIGASDHKGGAFGSSIDILEAKNINHHPNIEKGLLEEECSELLKSFFKQKRNIKK